MGASGNFLRRVGWLLLSVLLVVGIPSSVMLHAGIGKIEAASTTLLITEVCYDGTTPTTEGDEFVEIYNMTGSSINLHPDYKVGDEETQGEGEGMYEFPSGASIGAGTFIVIAKNADEFNSRFGFLPNYEFAVGSDNASVPNMTKYTTWASRSWGLRNDGDEVLLLGSGDTIVDSIRYGDSTFTGGGLTGTAPNAAEPQSLQRSPVTQDTDNMTDDFVAGSPTPGSQPTAITLSSFTARSPKPLDWVKVIVFTLAGLVAAGLQYFWVYEDAPRWLRILAPSIFAISLILIGFMAARG